MSDSIGRQEAIDTAIEAADTWDGGSNKERERYIREALEKLPPAQPERKKGYWKHINEEEERAKHNGQLLGWMPWYCSECGSGVGKHQTPFCPNCGADMRRINNWES